MRLLSLQVRLVVAKHDVMRECTVQMQLAEVAVMEVARAGQAFCAPWKIAAKAEENVREKKAALGLGCPRRRTARGRARSPRWNIPFLCRSLSRKLK